MNGVFSSWITIALAASSFLFATGCGEAFVTTGSTGPGGSAGTTGTTSVTGGAGGSSTAGSGGAGGGGTGAVTSGGTGGTGGTALDECTGFGTLKKTFFEDSFELGADKWNLGETWEIGAAMASVSSTPGFQGDPAKDHTVGPGNGLAGVNIGGDAPTNVSDFRWLTTKQGVSVSLSGEKLVLVYWRWLNSNGPEQMQDRVEVGNANGWNLVWSNDGPVQDGDWQRVAIDVTDYASADVGLRFSFSVETDAPAVSSWNIDDVRLIGCTP